MIVKIGIHGLALNCSTFGKTCIHIGFDCYCLSLAQPPTLLETSQFRILWCSVFAHTSFPLRTPNLSRNLDSHSPRRVTHPSFPATSSAPLLRVSHQQKKYPHIQSVSRQPKKRYTASLFSLFFSVQSLHY